MFGVMQSLMIYIYAANVDWPTVCTKIFLLIQRAL